MKCPNCSSQMFITDETANARSQVTFYRCSICVSKHVSSEPILQADSHESNSYFESSGEDKKRFLMI